MSINSIRSNSTQPVATARNSGAGSTTPAANQGVQGGGFNSLDAFSGKGDDTQIDDIIAGGLQALEQKDTFIAGDREMKISDALDKSRVDEIKAEFAQKIQDLKNQNLSPEDTEKAIQQLLLRYDASLGAAKQEDDSSFYQALAKMKEWADKIKEAIEG